MSGDYIYKKKKRTLDILDGKKSPKWILFITRRKDFEEMQIIGGKAGKGRGGHGKTTNCHLFIDSVPYKSPSFAPFWPTFSAKPRRNGPPKNETDKRFYRVLIPRLFLRFLNFKWDIDMKRFIVTICHYYHRP